MSYPFLEKINSPDDLKRLDKSQIPDLCKEIRSFLIESSEKHGGHLASNLGVVELTLAIHRVFNSPTDHIIFDVGHQSYVHKLITGRREEFDSLRTTGGLSGFTSRRESEHDAFGAGHSSTALSAALGFAEADAIAGKGAYTVAIIGDGAYTGGMVHEALNNCRAELPLIIILNENGMSISSNKGTFASYISRARLSRGYRRWKAGTNSFFLHIPLIGKPIKRLLAFVKERIKRLVYPANYFEELGLYYIGPMDGHNFDKIERALTEAKEYGGTVVIHLKTKKGKGYGPAEKSPDGYHSVARREACESFHSVAAKELLSIAKEDEHTVAVTAAMGMGTGLDSFGAEYPNRYFDVGIAEEHALTFSAGLAASGMKPYVAIYSTFLQRGYDNIIHDIALQNLPVRMLIDRAGLSLGDGATHHGIFDVAFLSHVPNVSVYAPVSYGSLRRIMKIVSESASPVAIRYSNSMENPLIKERFSEILPSALSLDFPPDSPPERVFITYGQIVGEVIKACDAIRKTGVSAGIILLERLKPLDDTVPLISNLIRNARRVIFVEEGIENGGVGQIMLTKLVKTGVVSGDKYSISAIDDNFAQPESPVELYDFVGLSKNKLIEKMMKNDY